MKLTRSRIAILAVGGSITVAIGVFYVIKDRTSFWLPKPLYCHVFPTTDKLYSEGEVEVCINAVRVPYEVGNGDVELDITFKKSESERIQAEGVFWVADNIMGRPVDYTGEINWSLIKTYDNGLLANTDSHKMSAWVDPLVPKDVHIPLWKWVKELTPAFDRQKLSLDKKFDDLVNRFIEGLSMIGTGAITLYKFLQVGEG
jgi:hypothetical protein